jgi:D-3-phosphoglycerate dehydrogenase
VDVKTGLSPEELKEIIGDYDGIIIRSSTHLTKDILSSAGKLKVIGRAGIGLDNVDIPEATRRGIVVMNTPQGNNIAAAEHTISMMLSMARKIPQATATLKSGKWEKNRFMGVQVYHKILGIVGIGNIGGIVADRAQGLKMRVIAYDPYISRERAREMGIELVSNLDDLFSLADFITVHTPLVKETRNLINKDAFKKMKDGVMIINCARGGIINERDLYDAIVSGKVAGAALDVFEVEPAKDNPLFELDQVIVTPHLGASTGEAQRNVASAIADQVIAYLLHRTIQNAVNVPAVSPEVLDRIGPYLDLAENLGGFLSQVCSFGIEEVDIEFHGEMFEKDTDPIVLSTLKGLLSPVMGDDVNFVNAKIMAQQRKIKIKESKVKDTGDYTNLIVLKIRGKNEEHSIWGTLFGKKEPRIVRFNDFIIEAIPQGEILLVENIDRPGVIGNLGTTLGKEGINIATMQFGRDKMGGQAISLLHLDASLNDDIMKKLLALPNIISVKSIRL